MADRTIARRWVRAFIELAAEQDLVDRLGADLALLGEIAQSDGQLLFHTLCNPVFTLDERRRVLDAVLAKLELHQLTANLFRLMLEKGRFETLFDLVSQYADEADARSGRVRVVVETAEPLTPQLEVEVRAALERVTGKTVSLETRIDPTLIGGMVARVGDTVYDASLRTRLQNLKHALISAQLPAEA